MRRLLRIVGAVLLSAIAILLFGGGVLAVEVFSRKPLRAVPSVVHALGRKACLDCHAPIAEEWRQSYHYKSVTGPYWDDVRRLGYKAVFDKLRKPCLNCHAPADVLDLIQPAGTASALGVECTPNLFKDPKGVFPAVRADEVELGVDCTACHVSRRGIVGSGRRQTGEHETIADARFQDPERTTIGLCQACHRAAVEAWKRTSLPARGITCLDCHMPVVTAASVAGGPARSRRSHRFMADKDPEMLAKAVNASLVITAERRARFRITNDRVGHYFPSGGNWLTVQLRAYDGSGRTLGETKEAFGKDEAMILDFWPFNLDHRIAFGEHKEVLLGLPEGHGTVEATVRYHDWMKDRPIIAVLKKEF